MNAEDVMFQLMIAAVLFAVAMALAF